MESYTKLCASDEWSGNNCKAYLSPPALIRFATCLQYCRDMGSTCIKAGQRSILNTDTCTVDGPSTIDNCDQSIGSTGAVCVCLPIISEGNYVVFFFLLNSRSP